MFSYQSEENQWPVGVLSGGFGLRRVRGTDLQGNQHERNDHLRPVVNCQSEKSQWPVSVLSEALGEEGRRIDLQGNQHVRDDHMTWTY